MSLSLPSSGEAGVLAGLAAVGIALSLSLGSLWGKPKAPAIAKSPVPKEGLLALLDDCLGNALEALEDTAAAYKQHQRMGASQAPQKRREFPVHGFFAKKLENLDEQTLKQHGIAKADATAALQFFTLIQKDEAVLQAEKDILAQHPLEGLSLETILKGQEAFYTAELAAAADIAAAMSKKGPLVTTGSGVVRNKSTGLTVEESTPGTLEFSQALDLRLQAGRAGLQKKVLAESGWSEAHIALNIAIVANAGEKHNAVVSKRLGDAYRNYVKGLAKLGYREDLVEEEEKRQAEQQMMMSQMMAGGGR